MCKIALAVPLIPPNGGCVIASLLSQKTSFTSLVPRCSYSIIGNVPSHQFLDDQRVFFWRKNESLPFSSLSQALPLVVPGQQKTDRKRVFGFEFMAPAELNKALRGSSGSLAGANPRTQSETTLIAHSTPTGATPGLRDSCIFPRPASQISMSDRECEPICYTKPTENSIIGSFLSERTLAAKQLCSFLDPDVSLAPLCRKKG